MKSYTTLYYLLTVLFVMGGFASMAQNSYGMQIISAVSIAFALIFLVHFLNSLNKKAGSDALASLEYASLFVIAVIFTFRSFQIYFPYVELLFGISGVAIAGIFIARGIQYFKNYRRKNITHASLIFIAYLSISSFSLAMVLFAFSPSSARYLGFVALVLIAGFLVGGIFYTRLLSGIETTSVFKLIAGFRDRFYLLLALFILFTFYVGLTVAGVLPRLYSDNYPRAYYKLVNEAETGKEKPVDGKYRYEDFKTSYDQFVKKNIKSESK